MSTLADHLPSPRTAHPATSTVRAEPRPANPRACRLCATGTVERLLDLGPAPLVNRAHGHEDPGAPAPLRLVRCGGCGVLQLEDVLDTQARTLIRQAASERALAGRPDSARRFCEQAIDRWHLRGEGRIVEIGSGTGSLLRFFGAWQLPVLGIEPAPHLARYARLRRIPTWCAPFTMALAERVAATGLAADLLIISIPLGGFENIPYLFDTAVQVLRTGGIVTFEIPDVLRIVGRTRFDRLRHADPAIPSIRQLQAMLATHGIDLVDVERSEVGADRLRVWARNREAGASAVGHPRLRTRLRAEAAMGIEAPHTLTAFTRRVEMVRRHVRGLLDSATRQGQTVVAWGASSAAVALASAVGLRRVDVAYAVDPETNRGMSLLDGTDIPCLGITEMPKRRPDVILALDDLPVSPRGWEGVPIYAVADLIDVVHRVAGDRTGQDAR